MRPRRATAAGVRRIRSVNLQVRGVADLVELRIVRDGDNLAEVATQDLDRVAVQEAGGGREPAVAVDDLFQRLPQ